MATSQQPPPQLAPQQHAAPPPGASNALDKLQSMINLVLIQSGQFLREQQAGGGSGRAKYALNKIVPTAIDRFQSSLDELENEIRQAQAVTRRDLALLQADRLKREQAEAAERQRIAAASSTKDRADAKTEDKSATEVDQIATGSTAPLEKDNPSNVSNAAGTSGSDVKPTGSPRTEQPPATTATNAPKADPLFDDTTAPLTAQDDDSIDFDAMFGPDGEVNGENTNNQGDAKPGDLDFNLDDQAPPSLLRGLEDFVPKGGDDNANTQQPGTDLDLDFPMPDFPDQPSNQTSNQSDNIKMEEESKAQQPTTTENNEDIMEPMATDSLDDLFNIDYDQEPSGFDDAFSAYEWK